MRHDKSSDAPESWLRRKQIPISSAADIVRVLLAFVAGAVAFWQFNTQWAVENERGARIAYREFLNVAIEHPELADPGILGFNFSREENTEYFWYVQLMNHTFEEIFAHVPTNKAWVKLAEDQIAFHCWFYEGEAYFADVYSQTFQETVKRVQASEGWPCREAPRE